MSESAEQVLLWVAWLLAALLVRQFLVRRDRRKAARAYCQALADAVTAEAAHRRRLDEIARAAEDIRSSVEEVRLMPQGKEPSWREEDVWPEGLGVVRPPARLAAQFPKLSPQMLLGVAHRRLQEHRA